ncbi:MAG: hypothetical protein R6W31_08375 [Bacteroidales bacterium]
MKRISSLLLIATVLFLTSCDPMSYSEWGMEPYTGAFTWKEVTKKAQWSNRSDHAAVAFQGKLWIFGGYDGGRTRGDTYLEDIWNSADGKDWSLVTESAPWKGRQGHTVTVFNDGNGDALYLVGGFEVDEETGYRQYTNDVWRSADGVTWIQIKQRSYPVDDMSLDFMPRFNHSCLVARHQGTDYLYIMGGSTMLEQADGVYSTHYFHDVWRSVNGMDWLRLDNNDFGQRSEHAACVDPSTGRIYLQGGIYSYQFDNEDLQNQPGPDYYHLWYSDDGITWETEDEFNLVRAGHPMCFYNNALWLFPGKDSKQYHLRFTEGDQYFTYTRPEGEGWSLDSEGSAFSARHSYAVVDFEGKIWVLGGETANNGPNNDVWSGIIYE